MGTTMCIQRDSGSFVRHLMTLSPVKLLYSDGVHIFVGYLIAKVQRIISLLIVRETCNNFIICSLYRAFSVFSSSFFYLYFGHLLFLQLEYVHSRSYSISNRNEIITYTRSLSSQVSQPKKAHQSKPAKRMYIHIKTSFPNNFNKNNNKHNEILFIQHNNTFTRRIVCAFNLCFSLI